MQKLLGFMPRTRFTRTLFFLTGDALSIVLAVFLAFFLRFEGRIPPFYFEGTLQATALLALVLLLPLFAAFHLYAFSWAYVSTRELWALFRAVSAGFLILTILVLLADFHPLFSQFPRSILAISYVLIFMGTGALRLSKRVLLYVSSFQPGTEKTNVLIVGAGDAGEQLLRSMLASGEKLTPAGFVDDSPFKRNTFIHGVRVWGTISEIPEIVASKGIRAMIVAMPSADSSVIQKAVELGRKAGLKDIKIVPSLRELLEGRVTLSDLRDVELQDLLGREAVLIDASAVEQSLRNKTVLITGAAGSIGSELSRQVARFGAAQCILIDQDETRMFHIVRELEETFPGLPLRAFVADITDEKKMRRIFHAFRPHLVFHAAAYKHVPLMEEHPDEAVKNNILGTKIIAEAAWEAGAERFVFISTDKSVNPTSVMGATKRVGEMVCQMLNQKTFAPSHNPQFGTGRTRFISVRFGNVLNSRGSVIPLFREQIRKGGPVQVTHPNMERYFMLISEACLLVLQAGAMGKGGEVFVLDMGNPIKIVDVARAMIRLSGYEPDTEIPIVFVGPRPGEKLFENILLGEEGTISTPHEKIFAAKLSPVDEQTLTIALEEFQTAQDRDSFVRLFQRLIPSYDPSKAAIMEDAE